METFNFVNERLWDRYFPVDFAKYFRAAIFQNTSNQQRYKKAYVLTVNKVLSESKNACQQDILRKYRRSCSQMFLKISVLKNFTIFTGKHLCWSLVLKMRLQHRCFPENIVKYFIKAFFCRTPLVVASVSFVELILNPFQASISFL